MTEESGTFEEITAEQGALSRDAASKPEPEGYDAWFRAQVREGLEECARPGTVFFEAEDVNGFMAERRRQRDAGLLDKKAS